MAPGLAPVVWAPLPSPRSFHLPSTTYDVFDIQPLMLHRNRLCSASGGIRDLVPSTGRDGDGDGGLLPPGEPCRQSEQHDAQLHSNRLLGRVQQEMLQGFLALGPPTAHQHRPRQLTLSAEYSGSDSAGAHDGMPRPRGDPAIAATAVHGHERGAGTGMHPRRGSGGA